MPVKPISKMGSPILSKTAKKVLDEEFQEVKLLLIDMQDTMNALKGIGIAATQIGVAKQVMMFGFDKNERYPNRPPIPFTVLINPEFRALEETMVSDWEGCLSVPGIRGYVPRYQAIQYKGIQPNGEQIERTVEGFHARVFQHEYDHLVGRLFIDHVRNSSDIGFEEELIKSKRI